MCYGIYDFLVTSKIVYKNFLILVSPNRTSHQYIHIINTCYIFCYLNTLCIRIRMWFLSSPFHLLYWLNKKEDEDSEWWINEIFPQNPVHKYIYTYSYIHTYIPYINHGVIAQGNSQMADMNCNIRFNPF